MTPLSASAYKAIVKPEPVRIELPWPSRVLHPNARVHWAAKARATKLAKSEAAWWAKAAGAKPIKANVLSVSITFFPPDKRRRDVDGMLASIKAYIDGIADVVGIDDSNWSISMRRDEPREHGAVLFEITEAA